MRIYWIAFIASLGGFLQSYVTCVIAGALIFVTSEFQLSPIAQGNIASIVLIGALAGALSSGYLADRMGRRRTLFLSAVLYCATALLTLAVASYTALVALRLITGLAVGITSLLVPMYLAEVAPAAKRGAFVTFYQLSITIGTLVAYFVNLLIARQGDWRMMFAVGAIPAAVQLLGFFSFPESPRWLMRQGRVDEANSVMNRLGMEESGAETPAQQQRLFTARFSFLILFGLVLCASQQFCGINAVVYFTPKIFGAAGFSDPQDAIFATLLVGITNVIATFLTIFLVDRFGRRKLLLISQCGVIFMLGVLILSFATDWQFVDFLAVGAVIFYVFLYSLGFGPIVWVLLSELSPLSVRAKALALCTFVSWLSNYLVVLTFPNLLSSLGPPFTFAIYALLTLLAYLYCLRKVPETKGKTLEELEKLI